MNTDTREIDGMTVLTPRETRIDAQWASFFRDELAALVTAGKHRIVINLQNVSFIDSSGLAAIVSVLKRIGPNGRLAVCALQPPVRHLFELTRLNRVIGVFDSEDAALAGSGGASA